MQPANIPKAEVSKAQMSELVADMGSSRPDVRVRAKIEAARRASHYHGHVEVIDDLAEVDAQVARLTGRRRSSLTSLGADFGAVTCPPSHLLPTSPGRSSRCSSSPASSHRGQSNRRSTSAGRPSHGGGAGGSSGVDVMPMHSRRESIRVGGRRRQSGLDAKIDVARRRRETLEQERIISAA